MGAILDSTVLRSHNYRLMAPRKFLGNRAFTLTSWAYEAVSFWLLLLLNSGTHEFFSSNKANLSIVGFGGDGPTDPLPLIHGLEALNLGTQTVRLIHTAIPCNIDQSQKWWAYQYRNSPTQEWNTFYAFPEVEFSEADFGVMNVSKRFLVPFLLYCCKCWIRASESFFPILA